MKSMFQIFKSVFLLTLLALASCGSDNSVNKVSTSSSLLKGEECSCNSLEMPVCGLNSNGVATTYTNSCMANCFGATNIVQGHCECSQNLVCLSDGRTLTECSAQSAIRSDRSLSITQFFSCNTTPPPSL